MVNSFVGKVTKGTKVSKRCDNVLSGEILFSYRRVRVYN